jgi:hypothetical protein
MHNFGSTCCRASGSPYAIFGCLIAVAIFWHCAPSGISTLILLEPKDDSYEYCRPRTKCFERLWSGAGAQKRKPEILKQEIIHGNRREQRLGKNRPYEVHLRVSACRPRAK